MPVARSAAVLKLPEKQMARLVWQWIIWIIVALGLDIATWLGLRHIHVLAENPGSASAFALCWVHPFVLPSVFDRPWRSPLRLAPPAAAGIIAAPLAIAIGFLVGLQASSAAFLIGFAFSGPVDGSAPYDPPGPLLGVVEDVLGDVMVWSGFAVGAAVAAFAAVGMTILLPGIQRARLSWWLLLAESWASILALPDWSIRALQGPWRERALLVAAGLPAAVLANWRTTIRNRSGLGAGTPSAAQSPNHPT